MPNQTATITGIVRDTDGNLVGGASVYITEGPVQFPDIAALTDAQGRFSLSAPVPGYYRIEVNASGAAPVTATVAITAGQQVQLDISVSR